MKLRRVTAADAAAIAEIYAPYVTGTEISFETEAPDAAEIGRRIAAAGEAYPWLVAEEDEDLLGYAYATAFRPRLAYRFAVETTVYVADRAQRRGVGGRLMRALLGAVEAQGYTQAIAAITLPNPASIALHEALGYGRAGVYQDVGYKFGLWRSVGLWQRALAPLADDPAEPLAVAAVIAPYLS